MTRLLMTIAVVALLGLPVTAHDARAQAAQPSTPPAATPAAPKADTGKADQQASAGQHIRDDQVRASKALRAVQCPGTGDAQRKKGPH